MFANNFHFNSEGLYEGVINSKEWKNAANSPYNFDTFNHAFASVFQIMTTENWNSISYDISRSKGIMYIMFPIFIITIGTYILLNLFLVIVLRNFEDDYDHENDDIKNAFKKIDLKEDNIPIKIILNNDDIQEDDSDHEIYDDKSLCFFSKSNIIRKFCIDFIALPYFESSVLVLIVISSITIIVDSPLLDLESDLAFSMKILDWIMTACFTIEMIMKIIASGLILRQDAYLRNGWNILDSSIVIVSLLSLILQNSQLRIFKSLRTFRTLRPLRLISRAPGLKIVVNTFIYVIPDVVYVLVIVMLFFSLFAILSVNFLKGDLRTCSGTI